VEIGGGNDIISMVISFMIYLEPQPWLVHVSLYDVCNTLCMHCNVRANAIFLSQHFLFSVSYECVQINAVTEPSSTVSCLTDISDGQTILQLAEKM